MSEIDLSRLSWRQLGFQLNEAKNGSNPDLYVYHKLLDEARRRAGTELIELETRMSRYIVATVEEATNVLPDRPEEEGGCAVGSDTPPKQPPLAEKVADMTHRGSGL